MSVWVNHFGFSRRGFKMLTMAVGVLAMTLGLSLPSAAQDPAPAEAPGEATPAPAEPAAADDPADPPEEAGVAADAVVATVNGEPITELDLAITAQFMGDQLTQFPEESWRQILIEVAVDFKLMGRAAAEVGLDEEALFITEMALLRDRLLRDDYIQNVVTPTVTEEDIVAAYIAAVAGMDLPEEVLIRHIMLATEAEATDVILQVGNGADFATLAFDLSLDRSTGEIGGLIDEYWQRGELIQELDDVVFTVPSATLVPFPIPIGENWHVIFVDELRRQPPPSFEEMRPGIEQQLIGLAYTTAVEELRNAAEVVIVGETPVEDPLAPAEAVAPAAPDGIAPAEPDEAVAPIEPDEAVAPVEPDAAADGAAVDGGEEEVAMVAGDAAIGAGVAGACLGCHSIGEGEPNGFGPNLFAILNRPVGGVADFAYSEALAALNAEGAVWTTEFLDVFLANPQEAAPGTTMPFGGFEDETIRANLIAYLATLTATPVD